MFWVIVYCVLVATGFLYCAIHDHMEVRHPPESNRSVPHK